MKGQGNCKVLGLNSRDLFQVLLIVAMLAAVPLVIMALNGAK